LEDKNADNDRTFGSTGNEGALRTALNTLRSDLSNAMVTTFTYDPLIGTTSVTAPNGTAQYYEYDTYNRLQSIKDFEGNIVEEHDYNYAQ